jgi:hypothetical protein
LRRLVLVLGDQLALDAAAFDDFDPATDAVWMAEVAEESTHVRSGKPRTVMFLSAMRHFAQALVAAGRPLHYLRLDDPANPGTLAGALRWHLERPGPDAVVVVCDATALERHLYLAEQIKTAITFSLGELEAQTAAHPEFAATFDAAFNAAAATLLAKLFGGLPKHGFFHWDAAATPHAATPLSLGRVQLVARALQRLALQQELVAQLLGGRLEDAQLVLETGRVHGVVTAWWWCR